MQPRTAGQGRIQVAYLRMAVGLIQERYLTVSPFLGIYRLAPGEVLQCPFVVAKVAINFTSAHEV